MSEDKERAPIGSGEVRKEKKSGGVIGVVAGLLIAGGIFGGQYLVNRDNIKAKAEELVKTLVTKPIKEIKFEKHDKYEYVGKVTTTEGEVLDFIVQTKEINSSEKEVYVVCRPAKEQAESLVRTLVESNTKRKLVSLSLTPSGLFYKGEGKLDSGEPVEITHVERDNNGKLEVEYQFQVK